MNWEALTATGTVLTAVIIAASALLGMQQLRELRRTALFDGTKRILDELMTTQMLDARRFVMIELQQRLEDREYRAELATFSVDPAKHPEILVLEHLEQLGSFMRYKLLFGETILESQYRLLVDGWDRLRPVVEITRSATDNPYLWQQAEWLHEHTKRWAQRYVRKHPRLRPSTGQPFTVE